MSGTRPHGFGVGKRSTPTPAGRFWIRERFAVPGRTLYGPYAFGTSAYSRLSDWPRGGVVGLGVVSTVGGGPAGGPAAATAVVVEPEEGQDDQQHRPAHDRRIGDVEHRPPTDCDEVDHVSVQRPRGAEHPVGQVAQRSTEHQAET